MIGLHRHSHYSKRDAIAKIPDIVARTAELRQSAWALTDHGTTSGLAEGYRETVNFNREHGTNIKFIFGVEGYWVPDYYIKDRKLSRHIILLAKNQTGYHNLLKLVTIAYGNKGAAPENYYYTMRLTTDTIAAHHEGLIVTSACRGGILQDRDRAVERAERFKEIFGEDFYLEIQTVTDEEQRDYNRFVLELADRVGVKTIVTEDAHYVRKEDAYVHRKWLEVDGKSGYYQTDDFYLHSDKEVRNALDYVPNIESIIENTEEVGRKCEQVKLDVGRKHYPVVDLGGKSPRQAVEERLRPSQHTDRVKYELDVLEKCDYLTYFVINHEMIRWCRQNGINVGRGRGSVCGSLVAYLLDITRVDPIRFGLFFERFANVERITPPDIDTDVPNSQRADVIDYLKQTYKEVWQVRTFGTIADRAAVQRASKAPAADRAMLAEKFRGLISHYGKHASAVIIFPHNAEYFCAIERQGGDYVCAYQFEDLERMGLLKLDILGMKTLDTITEAVNLIHKNHGVDVNLDNLPVDDPNTFKMLDAGDSHGCFQIESDGMQRLLRVLKPKNLFELVPLIALYRLSTIQSGVVEEYVKRAKDGKITYTHHTLKSVLETTNGVLLYQEQAMRIVQLVAGYSLAKADVFRRAIGHKDEQKMSQLLEQFIADGIRNGYDEDTMTELTTWLRNCAAYQFNKSHSAAYALLCYQTAYLKANFPLEYLAAYLNAHRDDKQEDLLTYIEYAQIKGITVLPPDVRAETADWHVKDGKLVTAIRFIKGIGDLNLPLDADKISRLPKNKILGLIKAGALDHLGDRKELVRMFLREDYAQRYRNTQLRLKKLKVELDGDRNGLFDVPANDKLQKQVDDAQAEAQKIVDEYRELETEAQFGGKTVLETEAQFGGKTVLGFEPDNAAHVKTTNRFERFKYELNQFDEPDLQSKERRFVLCYVKRVQLQGFPPYRRATLRVLKPAAIAIYIALLDVANRAGNHAGLRQTVAVDNDRLMRLAGIANKKTLGEHRRALVANRFIDYKKGGRGTPGTYTLLRLY